MFAHMMLMDKIKVELDVNEQNQLLFCIFDY